MTDYTFFESFKTKQRNVNTNYSVKKIFFLFGKEDDYYYIECVNSKLKSISPNPEAYSGKTKQILKLMNKLKQKQETVIDWERSSDLLYLDEHDYFIPMLAELPNIITGQGTSLHISNDPAQVQLHIEEQDQAVSCKILLATKRATVKDFEIVSGNYVLSENTIYPVDGLNDNFTLLSYFNTMILKNQLEPFLSLFFSSFESIPVYYENYNIEKGNPKKAVPTLVIRDLDENRTLELSVKYTVAEYPDDFLLQYDIQSLVFIDDLEQKIFIHDLQMNVVEAELEYLEKILNSIQNSLQIKNGYSKIDNLFIIEKPVAEQLLFLHLQELMANFTVIGSEKLSALKIKPVEPNLLVKLDHGIDFLSGTVELDIEGNLFSLDEVLNLYEKHSYITLKDGTRGLINSSYLNKLSRLFHQDGENAKVSFFDLPMVEDLLTKQSAETIFPKARKIFSGFNNIGKKKSSLPDVHGKLREYQKYGFYWLEYLYENNLGGCLADDMGLGKTFQMITLIVKITEDQHEDNGPVLIVMPTTLLHNWSSEIEKFAPKLTKYIYHGQNRELKEGLENDIILTSYGTLRRDIKLFIDNHFEAVVLDESQNIKNPESKISKAVALLKTNHRFALSGTPVENNVMELYSLFRFLNPAMFTDGSEFIQKYADPIQQKHDKEALRELKKKIYPFILRRTKNEVLKELPEKVEQVLYAEMDRNLLLYYEDRRKMYHDAIKTRLGKDGLKKSKFFILQAFNELRQIATVPERLTDGQLASPKLELLSEQIIDVVSTGHKALVFVNYLDSIEHIGTILKNEDIQYLTISGSTRNRTEIVSRFQNDRKYSVLIMTLKTGGVGLNLTAAEYVFIYDPWWNVAAEQQAVDRAHRIGQQNTVFSYKLITTGTIEEKILQLQERKKELVQSLLSNTADSSADTTTEKTDGEGNFAKILTEEDIDFILGTSK